MKAQTGIDTLVGLAILGLLVVILIVILFPEIKEALVGEGEKGACEWSLVMSSLTKLADWSLIPPECRAHRMDIDVKYLDRFTSEAKVRIKEYKNNPAKYGSILVYFNDPAKTEQVYEWALNKAVAQEMNDCWTKVFKGRLPLFDQWWNLYDFPWETPKPGESEGYAYIDQFYGSFKHPPVNCIVCSRIRFGDDVKAMFAGKAISSADLWLRYNYPRYGGKSYYEEITEGQSELNSLFVKQYEFSVDNPLAVLYEKIYYYQGLEKWLDVLIKSATGGKDGTYELNYLKLIPYTQDKIIVPPNYDTSYGNTGGEGCTFVLD